MSSFLLANNYKQNRMIDICCAEFHCSDLVALSMEVWSLMFKTVRRQMACFTLACSSVPNLHSVMQIKHLT